MSLASVIAGFRRRIQLLERGLGRVERRLGTELPPEWEAAKLAVNPLNLGYTPIVPLVFGGGMGSELRFPLGLTMVGGLLVSQVLTLFTTPVIYLAFGRLFRLQPAGAGADAEAEAGSEAR